VVVLSHGLWQRRFGSDTGIVDRTVRINGEARKVVVMSADFVFPLVRSWAPHCLPPRRSIAGIAISSSWDDWRPASAPSVPRSPSVLLVFPGCGMVEVYRDRVLHAQSAKPFSVRAPSLHDRLLALSRSNC
jgi:hypothetical protein